MNDNNYLPYARRRAVTASIGPYHIIKTNMLINGVRRAIVKLMCMDKSILICPYTTKTQNWWGTPSHFYNKVGDLDIILVDAIEYDKLCVRLRDMLDNVPFELSPMTITYNVYVNNKTQPAHRWVDSYAHLILEMLFELNEVKKVAVSVEEPGIAYARNSNLWIITPSGEQPKYKFITTQYNLPLTEATKQIKEKVLIQEKKSAWPVTFYRSLRGNDFWALHFPDYIECINNARKISQEI